jgi:hypothetical protein
VTAAPPDRACAAMPLLFRLRAWLHGLRCVRVKGADSAGPESARPARSRVKHPSPPLPPPPGDSAAAAGPGGSRDSQFNIAVEQVEASGAGKITLLLRQFRSSRSQRRGTVLGRAIALIAVSDSLSALARGSTLGRSGGG